MFNLHKIGSLKVRFIFIITQKLSGQKREERAQRLPLTNISLSWYDKGIEKNTLKLALFEHESAKTWRGSLGDILSGFPLQIFVG